MTQSRFAPSLSIVLTGSGGAGVMTAGQTLLDAATSCGLYGLMTRSTGPQIRGGEAAAMIRLSTRPVQCPGDRFDILLALTEAWPRTLTRSDLVQRLWGDTPPDSDPLRTHLYLLRQMLDKPFATPMLKTVHGVGFRLESDEDIS